MRTETRHSVVAKMIVRWAVVSMFGIYSLSLFGGCATLRSGYVGGDREEEILPEPEASPAVGFYGPLAEAAIGDAQQGFDLAEAAFDDSLYEEARRQYDRALAGLLGAQVDERRYPEIAADRDILIEELCLARIRVGRVLGSVEHAIRESDFDLPIEYNSRVGRWIEFYVTRGRETFHLWLTRSGRYVEMMRSIMASEGVPEDLAYLPLVESGYNPNAYSRARAVGIWQFISSTGEIAGLRRDAWVDQRRDPEKATHAAARHLKELYEDFGSWPLALAAYNSGQARVMQAIAAAGDDDFWGLSLPWETMDYVPRVYAAIIIAKDPEAFGFSVRYESSDAYEDVVFDRAIDLSTVARLADESVEELRRLNPELINGCTPPETEYSLRVPRGSKETLLRAFAELPEEERYLSEREVRRRAERYTWITYRVKRGDTLSQIAARYRTTVSKLKRWNPQARGRFIHPGDRLRIYTRGSG